MDTVDCFEPFWIHWITPAVFVILAIALAALVKRRLSFNGYWITLGVMTCLILLWREFGLLKSYDYIPFSNSIDPVALATDLTYTHKHTFARLVAVLFAVLAGAVVSRLRSTREAGNPH